jgi:hypothetical protein
LGPDVHIHRNSDEIHGRLIRIKPFKVEVPKGPASTGSFLSIP